MYILIHYIKVGNIRTMAVHDLLDARRLVEIVVIVIFITLQYPVNVDYVFILAF